MANRGNDTRSFTSRSSPTYSRYSSAPCSFQILPAFSAMLRLGAVLRGAARHRLTSSHSSPSHRSGIRKSSVHLGFYPCPTWFFKPANTIPQLLSHRAPSGPGARFKHNGLVVLGAVWETGESAENVKLYRRSRVSDDCRTARAEQSELVSNMLFTCSEAYMSRWISPRSSYIQRSILHRLRKIHHSAGSDVS